MQKLRPICRKKGGVIQDVVGGTGNLVILVIIVFVIISTLLGASLLTANSEEENTSEALRDNLSTGIKNVGNKIPTILLIGAVVILFGALVLLVIQAKRMGIGSSGSL